MPATDTGVRLNTTYMRHVPLSKSQSLTYFDEFWTNCHSQPIIVVGETLYQPNASLDQTSFRRNGFWPNVMLYNP